jgi:hypothetical protein
MNYLAHISSTPHVREKETTNEAQRKREKLEPLIRWLKNTTVFLLQLEVIPAAKKLLSRPTTG